MIYIEQRAIVRLLLPERTASYVVYGDVGAGAPVLETALTHDYHVRMHSLHVNRLAYRWASSLGASESDRSVLAIAAVLHDVGKSRVPRELVVSPERLSQRETEVMKTHVDLGVELVRSVASYERVALIVSQHHERIDGLGYPYGLSGDEIDPLARMLSVIDAFSAMVDDRPYRAGMPDEHALAELERCAGSQFDADMVGSFVAMRRRDRAVNVRPSAERSARAS